MKSDPAFCVRKEKRVIEFVGDSVQLARKAGYELGFVPKPRVVRYRVSADLVPIDACDYMSLNELFNLCVSARNARRNERAKARIQELARRFRFGRRLSLRMAGAADSRPAYQFNPRAAGRIPDGEDGTITYGFNETDDWLSIPYVSLTAEVTAHGDGMTPTDTDDEDHLTAPTEFWPVENPEIAALARRITSGHEGRRAGVKSILEWLTPGRNIRFGGPVEGSRWGVKKVFEQGYGRCWDFSDCFITLCRASGIPCRQVAGWLYGASGHVWAEVLIPGKGWQQVDPTGGGRLECGIYHIAYFTTETGDMPILYVSNPKIQIVQCEP
jgi:hypothetical protein